MFDLGGWKALEIIARVAFIYGASLVLMRVTGRREMAELSRMDLLVMLLIAETVSPALTGGDETVTGGVVAAATLLVLYNATGRLSFKSRRIEKLIDGSASVLIEDGRVCPDVVRKYRLTDDELRTTLHQHGLLHIAEVKRAFVEPDGEITIVKQTDHEEAQPVLRRTRSRHHDTLRQ